MKKSIGITILIQKENDGVWNNGIVQNAIYLYKVLENTNNYDAYLVNTNNSINITDKLGWNINEIKTVQLKDIKFDLDVLFVLGGSLSYKHVNSLQKRGCKVIFYNCGNNYVISMENILFDIRSGRRDFPMYDEVWEIPQMEKQNTFYNEMLSRTKVKTIPFIWDPMFIDSQSRQLPNLGVYNPTNEPKRFSIFEPNLNVYKYCLYPILIVEMLYRERPELVKKLWVTNAIKLKENKEFVSTMNHLDIVKNHLTSFEGRYSTPWFLSTHTDIVVSHQWENPLNYAYFDAVYLGYPLLHNAYLCSDLGYYYEEFDGFTAYKKLIDIVDNHDKNFIGYREENRHLLKRYLTTNPKNIEDYDILIKKII